MNLRYGLVGNGIQFSQSPDLHMCWMNHYGLKGTYDLWDYPAGAFSLFWDRFMHRDAQGANVTTPFKRMAFSMVSRLDPFAHLSEAVNTLARVDDIIYGYNTDSLALLDALDQTHYQSVVILGAGGVCMGSLAALYFKKCDRVRIFSRTSPQIPTILENHIGHIRWAPWTSIINDGILRSDHPHGRGHIRQDLDEADLIINATPLSGAALWPWISYMKKGCTFVNWPYMHQEQTAQLVQKKRGRFVDGLTLLYQQARYSFFYWFDRFPFWPKQNGLPELTPLFFIQYYHRRSEKSHGQRTSPFISNGGVE